VDRCATEETQLKKARSFGSDPGTTKIHLWFFVAGNNDLYLEKPELKLNFTNILREV